jgi:hypothetical protein
MRVFVAFALLLASLFAMASVASAEHSDIGPLMMSGPRTPRQ